MFLSKNNATADADSTIRVEKAQKCHFLLSKCLIFAIEFQCHSPLKLKLYPIRFALLKHSLAIRVDRVVCRYLYSSILYSYLCIFISDGHEFWKARMQLYGWKEAVERIIESGEYQLKFGTSKVPGKADCDC